MSAGQSDQGSTLGGRNQTKFGYIMRTEAKWSVHRLLGDTRHSSLTIKAAVFRGTDRVE